LLLPDEMKIVNIPVIMIDVHKLDCFSLKTKLGKHIL
jgi:hypothetical protein